MVQVFEDEAGCKMKLSVEQSETRYLMVERNETRAGQAGAR